ncbi:MAG: hypothetical protein ABI851_16160 [Saprospiraceae bacterium]
MNPSVSKAQNYYCPTSSENYQPDTALLSPGCIDVDEILDELEDGDNCRLIWINVNVHFFVNDDCQGNLIVPSNSKQSEANSIAEGIINAGNYAHYQNEVQKNQQGSVKLCNPFQYVLKGVYIHCEDDNIDARYNITGFNARFGVNVNSELNLYIAPCTNCTGIASGIGETNSAMSIIFLSGGNINHEFGHLMNLDHSWINDKISDTPPLSFDLDRNCDGDLFDLKEIEQQCWNKINGSDPVNVETDQIGMNSSGSRFYNGVNDCSEQSPCPPSPCCQDQWINNNTMAYNAAQNSFTYLQLKQMLMNLNNYKCEFINSIKTDRSCAPPAAFISDALPGITNNNPCKNCFDLSASFNEERYKIKLYKIINSVEQLVQETSWITGQADKICFTNGSYVGNHFLIPNTTYRLELIVGRLDGNCEDTDINSKMFTTSGCDTDQSQTGNPTYQSMIISPNPGTTTAQLSFDANVNEDFTIFGVRQSTGQLSEIIHSYIASEEGTQSVEINTNGLASGTYSILCIGTYHNYYRNWVKQ